jgi:hypothetical protein
MRTIYSLPPTQYGALWAIVVVVLSALIIGWLIALPILTRKRVNKQFGLVNSTTRATLSADQALRERYKARIRALADKRTDGEIDDRELHQGLSVVVREFVTERLGVRAETMTLTDLLANQRTAPMAYVIERCYNPAFSREGEILAMPGENDPRLVTIVDALKVVDSL